MPNLTRGTAQCTFDTGETYGTIVPAYDVSIQNSPFSDCIMDMGNKFALNYTQSSLLVSFSAGCIAKVGGAFWVLKQSANLTLPQNQANAYICLTIDKSQQDGSKCDITVKTQAQITKGILYAGGNLRDYPIYKVTTNSTGISSVEDLRNIVTESYLISESEADSITKAENTIYYVKED